MSLGTLGDCYRSSRRKATSEAGPLATVKVTAKVEGIKNLLAASAIELALEDVGLFVATRKT